MKEITAELMDLCHDMCIHLIDFLSPYSTLCLVYYLYLCSRCLYLKFKQLKMGNVMENSLIIITTRARVSLRVTIYGMHTHMLTIDR